MPLRTSDTKKLPDLLNDKTSQVTFSKIVKKVTCSHKKLADKKTHEVIFSGKGFENTFIAQRGDTPGKLNELSALDPIGLLKKNCPPGFSDMNFIYKESIPQYSELTSQGKDEFFYTHFNYDEQQYFTPGYIDGDDKSRVEDLVKMKETSDKTVANLQEQVKKLQTRDISIDIENLDNDALTLKLEEVNKKFDTAENIINEGNDFFLSNILNANFQDISNNEDFSKAESRIYDASKSFNDGSGLLRFISEYLELRKTEKNRIKKVEQQEERLIYESSTEEQTGGKKIIRGYKRKRGGNRTINTQVSISNDFTNVVNRSKELMSNAKFDFSDNLNDNIEKTKERKDIIEEQLSKMKRYIYEKKINTLLDSSENDIKSGIKQNEEDPSNIEPIKTKFNQAEKNLDDADSNLQILVNSFTHTNGDSPIIGYTDKGEDSELRKIIDELKKKVKRLDISLNNLRRIVRNCDAGNDDKDKCNGTEGCVYDETDGKCMTLENFNKIHLKRLEDDLKKTKDENEKLINSENELRKKLEELTKTNTKLQFSQKTIEELERQLRDVDTVNKNKINIERLEKELVDIKKKLEVSEKKRNEAEEEKKNIEERDKKRQDEFNKKLDELEKKKRCCYNRIRERSFEQLNRGLKKRK